MGQGIETIGLPLVVSSASSTNLDWYKCSNNVYLALATFSRYSYFTVGLNTPEDRSIARHAAQPVLLRSPRQRDLRRDAERRRDPVPHPDPALLREPQRERSKAASGHGAEVRSDCDCLDQLEKNFKAR